MYKNLGMAKKWQRKIRASWLLKRLRRDFIFLRASTLSSNASSMDDPIGEPSKVAVLGLSRATKVRCQVQKSKTSLICTDEF